MKWKIPVIDRNIDDITNRTSKAFFNVADWLRIIDNTEFAKLVAQLIVGGAISLHELSEPSMTTVPLVTDINKLVENIVRVRNASGMPTALGIPVLKYDFVEGTNAVTPDYEDVNDWERVLQIVAAAIVRSASYIVYCGVPSSGQVRFWQSQFRTFSGFVPPVENLVRHTRCDVGICGAVLLRQNSFRRYA